nr:NADH dehydrogenase subunit [Tanacetum cinerariifolium]
MNLESGWLIAASLYWRLSGRGGACYRNFFPVTRGEARPTTNEGGKLALLVVALFLGLVRSGKGRKERWSLPLGTWLVHSLAHELAASPEATKGAGLGPGRGEWSSGQKRQTVNLLKFFYVAWEQITQKIPGNNEKTKKRYLGNENYRGLYWRDPTVNSCPKEKPPGSPRTFSTVLYPRTSSLRAKQDRPYPFLLSIPPPSLLCSNRV